MFETGRTAADIIEEKGLKQVSDTGAIEGLIEQVWLKIKIRLLNIAVVRISYLAFLLGKQ